MMATFGLVQDFSVVAYDRWHTPIVWNLVTEAMFNVGRERERLHTNALWRMFFRPELRELLGEWEQIASRLIGLFRGALGRDPENADALEILAVMRASPDFERMWSAHEVSSFDSDTRENGDRIFHFRHPKHGMIAYHRLAIAIPSFAGGYLRFMTPSDDESRRHLATAVAHHIAEKGGRRLYDFAGLFNTVQLEDVRSALANRHSARHRDDLTGLRDPFRE
jgi:hypothetical protein